MFGFFGEIVCLDGRQCVGWALGVFSDSPQDVPISGTIGKLSPIGSSVRTRASLLCWLVMVFLGGRGASPEVGIRTSDGFVLRLLSVG
jgi:hypothetical protein